MCEGFDSLTIRTAWMRSFSASERSSASVARRVVSATSANDGEGDVGIELDPLEPQVSDPQGLEQRPRLARPDRVVELVERQNRAARHPRHEDLERVPRRFVEIEVQEEQADHQVRMGLDEFRDGAHRIALDQLDLLHVPEKPVLVVQTNQLEQLVVAVRGQVAGRRLLAVGAGPVLGMDRGKAFEAVEAVDAAGEVDRFEDGAEFGPAHQPEAAVDAALDHRALDPEPPLEDLVASQQPGQVLAADVLGKRLETDLDRIGAVVEGVRQLAGGLLLGGGPKRLLLGATTHRSSTSPPGL